VMGCGVGRVEPSDSDAAVLVDLSNRCKTVYRNVHALMGSSEWLQGCTRCTYLGDSMSGT
jgi:hypothetical protein